MVKNLSANVGDTGSIPGSGRSPGEENIDSLQYSCLGNPMDRKPGRLLQSMGSETVGRDLVTKWASLIAHWLKKKRSACNVGDPSSIPGSGRSPGEGKGYPLQHSDLENSMDFIVHGVAKSQTGLSNFHFLSSFL